MANPIVEKAKERMTQSHQSLGREFGSIRAGRANASLLDRIYVQYYGVDTPLNQIASITIPEARVMLITPFDKSSLKDIEHALNASDLGITPANDGSVIRLVIPALTEETRRDLAKEVKKVGDLKMPGFFSIFSQNMVCTAILMTVFFGAIMAVIGKPFFVQAETIKEKDNFAFYVFNTSLQFAVYLAILQLGVRTFVTELTASFQGIANKLLPSSVPGVDCAVCYGFGDANAVTFGFLAGLTGQIIAIVTLILMGSPTIIICGFVPVFFDNATIGLVANEKGGLKACLVIPFISGLIQVFGAAFISGWVGLANYGGYLGMFDWDTVWPMFTVVMHYLGYIGVGIVVLVLLAIPQIEYRMDPKGYFLITENYDAYLEHKKAQKGEK